jgi:prefoldin alpha subunit
LTTSFGQLKQAQAKYRSCVNDIEEVKPTTAGKPRVRIKYEGNMLMTILACSGNPLLVPLTSSLYVPGRISDPEHVVIDIGTGYYVKKASPPPHVSSRRSLPPLIRRFC